ncbi:MAG: NAD(P)/FAD-dependent oxidoreductase, partial [Pseudomonadota bacterium]|nr:NAD(P)/FAD-dependent oxidoreductase [Pseudomonadota bacterium]
MNKNLKIAVLGAGMSGMAMGHSLIKAGFTNFTIYEKADRVGGTWRENNYPGVACDVPSHLYSFSFERNPNWSEAFSPGGAIQQYFEATAEKYGLLPHCAFNRTLTHTSYENGIWRLDFAEGASETADIVVSAMGGLHVPQTPDFKGKNKFKGPSFHTAHWDHDIELTNKRVAIIGSAASAVQIVPQIIDSVAHLDVY